MEMVPFPNGTEAFEFLCVILNQVEDDFSDVAYDPDQWMADGRLYPPQADNKRSVPGRPDLVRYRHLHANTWIGDNGAILIKTDSGNILVDKPGHDGRHVELP